MQIGHPTRHKDPDQDEGVRYDRILARQGPQPRDALAEIQAPRRQNIEMSRQPDGAIVRALFAARETAASRVAALTPREREVLELILAGNPNKIIAWELGISQRTVENHRAAIMHKTDSHSVPALARLAIAAAWSDVDAPSVQSFHAEAVARAPNAMAERAVHVDFRKR